MPEIPPQKQHGGRPLGWRMSKDIKSVRLLLTVSPALQKWLKTKQPGTARKILEEAWGKDIQK